jgi:hypothetical protein
MPFTVTESSKSIHTGLESVLPLSKLHSSTILLKYEHLLRNNQNIPLILSVHGGSLLMLIPQSGLCAG